MFDGDEVTPDALIEDYLSLYRRFDQFIGKRRSYVDTRPLNLVADVFQVGRQIRVELFNVELGVRVEQ